MRLEGKVAIVTGSSRGIGRAVAIGFAKAGADVVVNCDKDVEAAERVAEEIRSLGRRSIVVRADVSRKEDVDRMVEETLNEFGSIDILVNNAGIFTACPIEDLEEEDWDRVMNVNLKGVFLCSQAVGRHMIKKKSGVIINIASISGHIPETRLGAYTPSKAGVLGLTSLLAVEWAKHNIRVNAISPGPIRTALHEKIFADEVLREARHRAVPLNRPGEPEEIAKIAEFLASDDSSYVTGQTIVADGGSMMSMFYLVHLLSEYAKAASKA
ncbi:MAG: SDR family NAD(P)-dependent oxidoreductase [Candidatus Geothermarchaeales archaeon]